MIQFVTRDFQTISTRSGCLPSIPNLQTNDLGSILFTVYFNIEHYQRNEGNVHGPVKKNVTGLMIVAWRS